MKRLLSVGALLLALGMAASLAVADMDGPRVPPKGTEGPDIASQWRAWRARMSVVRPLPRSRISTGWLRGKALTISGVGCERRGHPRRSRYFWPLIYASR
jgi:hypothetical protein